jgi:hypothetical protein
VDERATRVGGYYRIGGKRYPSVTTILGKMIPKNGLEFWKRKNKNWKELREEAAFNGTLMHLVLLQKISGTKLEIQENLLEKKWTRTTIAEIKAREHYWNELGIKPTKPIMVEHTIHIDDPCRVAGTADHWGGMTIGGQDAGLCVTDLKSSKKPQRTHELQIGAYVLGLEREGKKVDTGLIPYVREDSSELVILEREELTDRGYAFMDVARRFYQLEERTEE